MNHFASYCRPKTREELYALLKNEDRPVLFFSGGTDILVQNRKDGRFDGCAVFDLTGIEELGTIREECGHIVLGAEVTHDRVAESPLLERYAGALCSACRQVGAQQLRNRATIGGNIANASPAGDTLGPLAAFDAVVRTDLLGMVTETPITEFILGPGKRKLKNKEFIREIVLTKTNPEMLWRFRKVGRRNALAISRLTLTLLLSLDENRCIREYRASIGATFPHPMRFPELERKVQGLPLTEELCQNMAEELSQTIPQVAGVRSSTKYKEPVVKLLTNQLLREMGGF